MNQDEEHLRLLSIFHYVVAGLAALFALFPIIHLVIGLIFIFAEPRFERHGEAPADAIGWIFVIFSSVIILTGWVFATFVLINGRFLAKRKNHMFCLVMAGIECIFMPFGTVLGVFTILVLMRESVKKLFAAGDPIDPSGRRWPTTGSSSLSGSP
jgi:uncharacterized membrane protein